MSLVSGRAVAGALAERGHVVRGWLIDLDGGWWRLPAAALDPAIAADRVRRPGRRWAPAVRWRAAAALERAWPRSRPTPVCFPALHGPFGEDGTVQALLGVGGPRVLRLGSRGVRDRHGQAALQARLRGDRSCRSLPWVELRARDGRRDQRAALARARERSPPICPIRGWSSSPPGSARASASRSSIARRAPGARVRPSQDAFRYDDLLLAEPYLDHPRELEVAVRRQRRRRPRGVRAGRDHARPRVLRLRRQVPRRARRAAILTPELDAGTSRADIRRIAGDGVPGHRRRAASRGSTSCWSRRRPAVRVGDQHDPRLHADQPVPAALRGGGYDFGGDLRAHRGSSRSTALALGRRAG